MQKTVTIRHSNIDVPKAYARIQALRVDYPNRVYVQVAVFDRRDAQQSFDSHDYEYDVMDDFGGRDKISFASAYARVMQEPEWQDAKPVFEESKLKSVLRAVTPKKQTK